MADFDTAFVRSLRAGDARAFEMVVRAFAPRLRRMAMRYFHSPFEQEEAVQEALLKLHRARATIDPLRSDELPQYVLTLARRQMIDLWRARRSEPVPEALAEAHWEDDARPVDEGVVSGELKEVLERFEARLKPAYRPFFRAVFIDGHDFDEARKALGLGRLRAKYLKKVLLGRLRRHGPLLELLGRKGGE